ncbi:hypothetical protein SY111_16780 [Ligilactobacillus agilis]|uniref:Uncharacterized protein n=1 Tax=Ligilactobacillus agilis TaxID=1601 RepID=A0A6F9XUT5_9LACO|nr:hypothetical protein [Ligilactobacillus agilis]MCI5761455.1 hypothetical protein [Ligilactobacillus agilis]GET09054.1 hypothetical protein SY111_16780 [Ligilactobacillus agilis]
MELQLLSSEAQDRLTDGVLEIAENIAMAKFEVLKGQNKQRLKTRAEAAKYLHLSGNSFDEVVRPYIKTVHLEGFSRLMWDVRDLDRFIDERKS